VGLKLRKGTVPTLAEYGEAIDRDGLIAIRFTPAT
jgi:hypothetical protein